MFGHATTKVKASLRTHKRERVEAQHKQEKETNRRNFFLQSTCTKHSAQQNRAVGILKQRHDAWLQQLSDK